MAQGKVVATPVLMPRLSRPAPPFNMSQAGLAPNMDMGAPPAPEGFGLMPGLDPNVRNFSGDIGTEDYLMPDGLLSSSENMRQYQEGLAKVKKANVLPYLDLSTLPMEQFDEIPEEPERVSGRPAMAAAGIMGLLGGGFGARAGAHAAEKFASAADSFTKEKAARDLARTQLRNELKQQRNAMTLRRGDLQNDDVARHNQEEQRREAKEIEALEKRFALVDQSHLRWVAEEERKRTNMEKERQRISEEDGKNKRAKAANLYSTIGRLIAKADTMSAQDRSLLQKLMQQAIDPEMQMIMPQLGDMTEAARQRLAFDDKKLKQQGELQKSAIEMRGRIAADANTTANRRISVMQTIARDHDNVRRAISSTMTGKFSTNARLKWLESRSKAVAQKFKDAESYARRSKEARHSADMLTRGNSQYADPTYIDQDPRYSGLTDVGRSKALSHYTEADHLDNEADRLIAEARQEQADIANEFRSWAFANGVTGSPSPSPSPDPGVRKPGGNKGGAGSNVRPGSSGVKTGLPVKPGSLDDALRGLGNLISDREKK